jgi:hypothetical protein
MHPAGRPRCSNRALAQLSLGEYRKCVEDCDSALSLDPRAVKALYRKAKVGPSPSFRVRERAGGTLSFVFSSQASLGLGEPGQALAACDAGLAVNAENKEIRALRFKVLSRAEGQGCALPTSNTGKGATADTGLCSRGGGGVARAGRLGLPPGGRVRGA